jgi:hypothetical protein
MWARARVGRRPTESRLGAQCRLRASSPTPTTKKSDIVSPRPALEHPDPIPEVVLEPVPLELGTELPVPPVVVPPADPAVPEAPVEPVTVAPEPVVPAVPLEAEPEPEVLVVVAWVPQAGHAATRAATSRVPQPDARS